MKNSERLPFVDFLRAVCILYIVGFWHLMNYTKVFRDYHNQITMRCTVVCLGLFIFLSGYLLALKPVQLSPGGILDFYKRRFLRIYPLYIAALCTFWAMGIIKKTSVVIKAGLTVSMFYGPSPPTLWFVTMLVIFYLSAPFLISNLGRGKVYWALSIGIFSLLVLGINISTPSDVRIVMYFPAFALGIYWSALESRFKGIRWKLLIVSAFLLSIVASYFTTRPEHSAACTLIATFGPLLIFVMAEQYVSGFGKLKLFRIVGYAGFVAYLIHRPVFKLMKSAYFPTDGVMQLLYLVFVCLPILISVSWIIQWIYDRALFPTRKRKAT